MSATEQQITNIKNWLKALRSGEYPQTQQCLRNAEGYCCLGVLGDVVPGPKWTNSDDVTDEFELVVGDEITYDADIPHALFDQWTGLSAHIVNPKLEEELADDCKAPATHPVTTLIELNDDYGADFGYIADVVEAAAKAQGIDL